MELALEELVRRNINLWLYDTAAFYAERLMAEQPSEESLSLVAVCYHLQGEKVKAHDILQGCQSPQNRYMLASLCCDLRKFSEVYRVLLAGTAVYEQGFSCEGEAGLLADPCPVPGGAAGLLLLGRAAKSEGHFVHAAKYFRLALRLDPLLWGAFDALCWLGEEIDAERLFGGDSSAAGAAAGDAARPSAPEDTAAVAPLSRLGAAPAKAASRVSWNIDAAAAPQVQPWGPPQHQQRAANVRPRATFSSPAGFASPALNSGVFGPGRQSLPDTGAAGSSSRGGDHSGGGGAGSGRGGTIGGYGDSVGPDSMGPPPPRDPGGSGYGNARGRHSAITPVGGGRLSFGGVSYAGGASVSLSVLELNAAATPARAAAGAAGGGGVGGGRGLLFQTPGLTPIGSSGSHAGTPSGRDTPGFEDEATPFAAQRTPSGPAGTGTPVSGILAPAAAPASAAAVATAAAGADRRGAADEGRRLFSGPSDGQYTAGTAADTGEKSAKIPRNANGSGRSSSGGGGGDSDERGTELADMDVDGSNGGNAAASGSSGGGAAAAAGSRGRGAGADDGGDDGEHASASERSWRELSRLLQQLGTAWAHLSHFRCREAIKVLQKLPQRHFATGWVQSALGRAFFEIGDHASARDALQQMARWEPHRVEGLEVLSSVLWHLRDDVELCYLAQRVSHRDRLSPSALCVLGNCFSLQKEHNTALKFFQRATQMDPGMAYAHTLCGHEHVANEEWEKAMASFRAALTADRRHSNAWYGLGAIYYRLEKHEMAEYHFKKALSINPQSSVLCCYLGMAQHANKRYFEALETLNAACALEPLNPQARFQKANVLMSMERYAKALKELESVCDSVPKEGTVYFALGKVCKKLNRPADALRYLTMALDLKPKDNSLVKSAIDHLEESDLDGDSQWA